MSYKTPGVYVEEISTLPASIAGVDTAIPAFVGYTEKAVKDGEDDGLLYEPTRVTSLLEYREKFGGPDKEVFSFTITDELDDDSELVEREFGVDLDSHTFSKYKLYYSLQLYFDNGGGPCYIVSVGDYDSTIEDENTDGDEGLKVGIKALEKVDEPTLILFPDAVSLGTKEAYGGVVQEALTQCNKLKDRFTVIDRYYKDDDSVSLSDFRESLGMSYLSYGAVYHPFLKTILNYQVDEENSTISHESTEGGTLSLDGEKFSDLEDNHPSVYRSLEAELKDIYVELPPSGAVAGVYARVDRNRGVWKAPANVSLNSVIAPTVKITDDIQAKLNVDSTSGKSINAIRSFTGKGTLVWGARTLAGNDNEWRYIPVRRLYIYVEESVKKATEFVVFEPNTANTWVRVRAMIENFLTGLWRNGALAGATTEDAFFVKVGLGETMTSQDILEGRMIVEIGLAAVRPAEFIILRFMHKLQES
ncbi:MAG: phage tail sheath C-terminal domain-containing protein [Balneolaceae bacterium]